MSNDRKIKRKPRFVRQDAHKKKRVGSGWRRPKGMDSKMRLGKKGHRKCVSVGYGSAKKTRGLHKSGLSIVIANSKDDVEKIYAAKSGAVIASSVGKKKRVEIIKKCQERSIKILNIKNADDYLKMVDDELNKRKESKKNKEKKKVKTREEGKKETPEGEAPKKEKEKTKEEEKKEKDKLLIKKELQ